MEQLLRLNAVPRVAVWHWNEPIMDMGVLLRSAPAESTGLPGVVNRAARRSGFGKAKAPAPASAPASPSSAMSMFVAGFIMSSRRRNPSSSSNMASSSLPSARTEGLRWERLCWAVR